MLRARVVLVTDPAWPLERLERVTREAGRALGPGRLVVQLRDKASADAYVALAARALRRATADVGALLLVNAGDASDDARMEIAEAVRADGVHLPGPPDASAILRARDAGADVVTVAAHDDDDVRRASLGGADAVLVSPVFASPGKGAPRGEGALCAARAILGEGASCRLIALGGVTAASAASCASAGADGVAVIRALLDAADPSAVARALAAPFDRS